MGDIWVFLLRVLALNIQNKSLRPKVESEAMDHHIPYEIKCLNKLIGRKFGRKFQFMNHYQKRQDNILSYTAKLQC